MRVTFSLHLYSHYIKNGSTIGPRSRRLSVGLDMYDYELFINHPSWGQFIISSSTSPSSAFQKAIL